MAIQEDLFTRGEAAPVDSAVVEPSLRRLASALPERVRLGTSSWSFPGWAGLVYDRPAPESVLVRHGLTAYARHPLFRTVGVDRSYYETPSAAVFRDFARSVPGDFRFVVKAERSLVTPSLRTPGGWAPAPFWLHARYATDRVVSAVLEGLGERAGPILFQFPPLPARAVGGPHRFADDLEHFLEELPGEGSYAVEIRTPELLTRRYAEVLERTGAVHGFVEHPKAAPLERQTALFPPDRCPGPLLVRWMLRRDATYEEAREAFHPFDRLRREDPGVRARIGRAVLDALVAGREVFVVINNKAEGSSPLSVARLARWLVDAGGG